MATDDFKRKLTAIFSADVVDYSRLMGEDEVATVQTLTSHKETMRKMIRQLRNRKAQIFKYCICNIPYGKTPAGGREDRVAFWGTVSPVLFHRDQFKACSE